VIDATILIPTHAHADLLPFTLRSALAQSGVDIEVFVVGDGVTDETRDALRPFLADPRVRFFDNSKGERHGEAHRHAALGQANGRAVCYLSDDDLLLQDHVAEMLHLLDDADFAHSAPVYVEPDGSLAFMPIDLARPDYRAMLAQGRWNAIGLTGAAHTLAAYRRLPIGWHPAPEDVWTDLHMWRQFLTLPGFRGVTGSRVTAFTFPSPVRTHLASGERADELARWERRLQDPVTRSELAREADAAARRAAADYRAHAYRLEQLQAAAEEHAAAAEEKRALLQQELADVQATRTWRVRNALVRIRPLRALLARSNAAR
jgi:glycosyltransferase involved in cell wall biosynthesis